MPGLRSYKCQSETLKDAEARRQQDARAKELSASLRHSRMQRQEDSKMPGLRSYKCQSETLKDAEARRQQDARAKAAKRRSESLENAEARRQQDAQTKKRYSRRVILCTRLITMHRFILYTL